MDNIKHPFKIEDASYEFEMVFVEGTGGEPFLFGVGENIALINIESLFYFKISGYTSLVEVCRGQ